MTTDNPTRQPSNSHPLKHNSSSSNRSSSNRTIRSNSNNNHTHQLTLTITIVGSRRDSHHNHIRYVQEAPVSSRRRHSISKDRVSTRRTIHSRSNTRIRVSQATVGRHREVSYTNSTAGERVDHTRRPKSAVMMLASTIAKEDVRMQRAKFDMINVFIATATAIANASYDSQVYPCALKK